MALWVMETFINATEKVRYGEAEPYETGTDDTGVLYRQLRHEYGTAKKMYQDFKSGEVAHIGWVFHRRVPYERSKETYLREIWVTVLDPCPLEDPEALRRKTRLGEERICFKYHKFPL